MKKIMTFASIFSIILVSYFAAHLFVYFSLVKFFVIGPKIKLLILIIMMLFASSFFAATYLSHVSDNVFTRGLYFLSGSWVGFLVHLMFSFVLVWLLVFAFSFFTQTNVQKPLAIAAIIFAIGFSSYGIWNAFNPRIKNIEVHLKNLPDFWKGKRIVQLSDVHLGHIYTADYMNRIADQVNSLNPDVILITGDLFDGTDGKLDVFIEPLKRLKAANGIYFSTGNHETYLGTNKALEILSKTDVVALRDEMKNVEGLQLIGIDYPERLKNKDISKVIGGIDDFNKDMPSILLWHIPNQIKQAKDSGISLMLSGHTHRGQIFPFQFVTSIVFHGYDYGLKQDGDFSIYTSSGLGGWGPPMRTENRSEIVNIVLK